MTNHDQSQPARLHSFSDEPFVLLCVLLEQSGGLLVGGAFWVWVVEERLDAGEDGGDAVSWSPSVAQDIKGRGRRSHRR